MKYRSETQEHNTVPKRGWQATVLWLVGFPGYIIFLFGWLGVLAALAVRIAKLFITPAKNTAISAAGGGSGHVISFGPLATVFVTFLCLVVLAIAYWATAEYTMRTIRKIAEFLDTNVWVIKLVGLPLGCVLAAICLMLFRPDIGLAALGSAVVLIAIGYCSFGLEYAWIKHWNDRG